MSAAVPFRYLVHEIDVRAGTISGMDLLSVSQYRGVIPRSELTDKESRSDDLSNYKRCWVDDIVLNRMSAYQGALGIARQDGLVSPDYAVLRSTAAMHAPFLAYLMKSNWFVSQMVMRLRGIGAPGIGSVRTPRVNIEDLGDVAIPLPPLAEQARIARFLDDQTTRIDNIITARQKQIELRAEAFGARLDSAIPRGDRRLLPFLQLLRDGTHASVERVLGGIPLLSVRNLQDGEFVFRDDDSTVSEEVYESIHAQCPARKHDILLAIVGATLGKTAQVTTDERFCLQRSVAVLRSFPAVLHSRYLLWALRSRGVQDQLWLQTAFSAQPGVYLNSVAGLRIRVPSMAEQRDVAKYLDAGWRDLGGATDALKRSNHLLQEFKHSLISAAVSGEFDVSTASGRGVPA